MVKDTYSGRNVLNAPAIKIAIEKRSNKRQEADDIKSWLKNHFFRYIISSLQTSEKEVIKLKSVQQAEALLHPKAVPEWSLKYFKNKQDDGLWWIDPEGEELLAIEVRLVEFLSSRKGTSLEGKLSRINCFQALAFQAREHAIFESKAAIGWHEHNPNAVKDVLQGENGTFIELLADSKDLRKEMAFESQIMRHCLGQFSDKKKLSGGYGEHYANACETGKMRLFSYRKGQSQPHITISTIVEDDGKLTIDQIKGKQNKPPINRYSAELIIFLNSLNTSNKIPSDAINIGIVRTTTGWCAIADVDKETEQLKIVATHPQLYKALKKPSLLVQWVVIGEQSTNLESDAFATSVAKAVRG